MFTEIIPPKDLSGVTVISIIKDEMFYLAAFLDHYRSLGVVQFIFLDDRSTDGTREYLIAQPDCAVITSDFTYGQIVNGKTLAVSWKSDLAKKYCTERWALVVDLDELLILPEKYKTLENLTEVLDRKGLSIVPSIMIDFYPAHIDELENHEAPSTKEEMFSRYPFFDDCDHGAWVAGANKFETNYGGVRERLMLKHGIDFRLSQKKTSMTKRLRNLLRRAFGIKNKKSKFNSIHKVPLIKWSELYEYRSAHSINAAPSSGIQLPLAHFKFTGSVGNKIDHAISSKAYYNHSSEYQSYQLLLSKMIDSNASFICEKSRRYVSSSDFLDSNIMKFDI